MSEPKSAAELALAYTRSIWAPGEMYPKHMTEAFLAGHAAGRESAGELVEELGFALDDYIEQYNHQKTARLKLVIDSITDVLTRFKALAGVGE